MGGGFGGAGASLWLCCLQLWLRELGTLAACEEEVSRAAGAARASSSVPPTLFWGVPALPASSVPAPEGPGAAAAAGLAAVERKVAGIMIPEEVQRLLEGNHKFLLVPLPASRGKSAAVQGKKLKGFLLRAVRSQREEWKDCGSCSFSKADGFGVRCVPSLPLTPKSA